MIGRRARTRRLPTRTTSALLLVTSVRRVTLLAGTVSPSAA